MKRLEQMKECLIACVQNQINGHLDQVDTKELGEAIDMIKDLEEAIYYCTITKALKENEEEQSFVDPAVRSGPGGHFRVRYPGLSAEHRRSEEHLHCW